MTSDMARCCNFCSYFSFSLGSVYRFGGQFWVSQLYFGLGLVMVCLVALLVGFMALLKF